MVIQGGALCCDAANRIAHQKFLAAHAPALPLGGCSQPDQCRCKYHHLPDRRQERRRDSDFGLPSRVFTQNERRNRKDRRHTKSNQIAPSANASSGKRQQTASYGTKSSRPSNG